MGQGASVIRDDVQTTHVFTTSHANPQVINRPTSPEMVCEACSASFNVFKRKKLCKDCGRYFCTNCVMQLQENAPKKSHRQCKKCNILTTGNFTRQDLQKWKVKDLRSVLNKRNISTDTCTEKHDLIDLLLVTFGTVVNQNNTYNQQSSENHTVHIHGNRGTYRNESDPPLRTQTPSEDHSRPDVSSCREPAGVTQTAATSTSHQQRSQSLQNPASTHTAEPQRSQSLQQTESDAAREERLRQRQEAEMREAERIIAAQRNVANEQQTPSQERTKRFTIKDIKSLEDIDTLTVRQMKEVLVNNFVDYKGCVEKSELQQRLQRLWKEHQNNQQKAAEIINASDNPGTVENSDNYGEDDLCKICMDAAINCVLLECGHMVTCTQCGRRLAECPICRQNVVRVVHTFKS